METLTVDGPGTPVKHKGGVVTCMVFYTSGSGTTKYQFCPRELNKTVTANWMDTGISFTATGMQNATLPDGWLRPYVSGSSTPSFRSFILGTLGRSAPEVW